MWFLTIFDRNRVALWEYSCYNVLMRRITHWKWKLLLTGAYGILVLGAYLCRIPCLYLGLLHISCPGCGMTRAWLCALHLDFAGAFAFHPMFWAVPLCYLFILFDGHLFRQRWLNIAVLAALALGFGAVFFLRLYAPPPFLFAE